MVTSRFPHAIKHYYATKGEVFALRKVMEFATRPITSTEAKEYLNFALRIKTEVLKWRS